MASHHRTSLPAPRASAAAVARARLAIPAARTFAVFLLLGGVPALAQTAASVQAPSGYATVQAPCTRQADGSCLPVSAAAPLPMQPTVVAATSTAQEGTITATAAVATSGAATFAGGAATIGPLTPQLGRDIRIVLKGVWAGTVQIGTSTATNMCAAGTINPLTIGGSIWGSYTANANEAVDTPTLAGIVYCATATVTSGTLAYAVRQ